MKAESGLYSNRIDEMNDTIASLQSQLAEKNRVWIIIIFYFIAFL